MTTLKSICGGSQIAQLSKSAQDIASLDGEVWECGVYQGGTAALLHDLLSDKIFRLFDTFGPGIPLTGPGDHFHPGMFPIDDKTYQDILAHFAPYPNVMLHKGIIPDTFAGLENSKICFAHIDVDAGQTYTACLDFIWPRLVNKGIMVFDDYASCDCLAATAVVDEFVKVNNIELHLTPGWGGWIQKH